MQELDELVELVKLEYEDFKEKDVVKEEEFG